MSISLRDVRSKLRDMRNLDHTMWTKSQFHAHIDEIIRDLQEYEAEESEKIGDLSDIDKAAKPDI